MIRNFPNTSGMSTGFKVAGWCLFCSILLSASIALAEEPVEPEVINTDPTDKTFLTEDGWQLSATYYPSGAGREAPVVLLLHGRGGNRLLWTNTLIPKLREQNYAVISLDLRKHGGSRTKVNGRSGSEKLIAADYVAMGRHDLASVKNFIYEEHQREMLNMSKMGIVASDMSAPIALFFTVDDWMKRPYNDAPLPDQRTRRGQDVRSVVLISPDSSVPQLASQKAVNVLRDPRFPIGMMVCYGTADEDSKDYAEKLEGQFYTRESNRERFFTRAYPVPLKGTELLGRNLEIENDIVAFFDRFLKTVDVPWEDRRSNFER